MENPALARRCCFQWDIFNPFIPWRDLEATFYHGFPTVTQWKVIIRPMDRRFNYLKFLFSLKFDEWFDYRNEILAENLLVFIKINEEFIERKEVRNHIFCSNNRYTFDFTGEVYMQPQFEAHHLYIRVEISLPGRAIGNEVGGGTYFEDDDLMWLSQDLMELLNRPQYSNMKLMPRNVSEPIEVHSYIIDARWNNFFCLHDFEADTRDTVETNISSALLFDILIYMYSGTLSQHWPDWTTSAYITELFQVIDRYKLYHLYKVFVKNDLQQVRMTRNSVLTESRLLPLESFNGRPTNCISYTWNIDPNPEYEFIFQIKIRNDRPWLSYSLQSKSSSSVYAQVNLEIVKKVGRRNNLVYPFHGRDYTIDPNETVEARRVLFLGCSETFGNFISRSSGGTRIKFFIRLFLKFIDGATLEQVRSVHDNELQNDLERFRVLSDHMYKLRRLWADADMSIESRTEGNELLDHYRYSHHIHKGIFASRVPEFWSGLENVPYPNDPPNIAVSILSYEALPIVLDYVYTGKVSTMPLLFLDEIEDFATRTLFFALIDFINRIRLQ